MPSNAAAGGGGSGGAARRRPNIVIICTDQWRADCLSSAGHPDVYTPNLDLLAARGTRFDAAYCPAPTCVPARMSLLTGLAPASHGRVGYSDGVAFDVDQTIASHFAAAGYQTQAIGKMHVYPQRARVGFDNVILHDGYLHHARAGRRDVRFYDDYQAWLGSGEVGGGLGADEFANGIDCNSVVAAPWDRPEWQHPTNWATTEAIDWLYRRDPTAPFLLYLSYHRPHAPYNPPQWAFDYYLNRELSEYAEGDWEDEVLGQYRREYDMSAPVASHDAQVERWARAGYYGNITHLDAQIGRFLAALADFGLERETIVVFTSDHGDMQGEHGMWRKGYPYEGSARIPLLIAGPGVGVGESAALTDLTDLFPTLSQLAGLPAPVAIDGRSQAAEIADGAAAAAASAVAAASAGGRAFLHGEHYTFGQSLQWIIDAEYKYIWWSEDGREQLFDRLGDPHELHDLALARGREEWHIGAVLERMRARLVETLAPREEGFVKDGKLQPGRQVGPLLRRVADYR